MSDLVWNISLCLELLTLKPALLVFIIKLLLKKLKYYIIKTGTCLLYTSLTHVYLFNNENA